MYIAIVVRILWPGGVQRTAFAEADGLGKLGHDVDLIFIRDTERVLSESTINFRILNNKSVQKRFLNKILHLITRQYAPERGKDATIDLDLIWKFEKNRHRYDIVIYFDEFAAFFSKKGKILNNDQNFVVIHEVHDKSKLWSWIIKRSLSSASGVITNSEDNANLVKKYYGKESVVLRPGLKYVGATSRFEERENIAISVTMWDYGRHPETLLEIAKNLSHGKILLVGSWADYEYMASFKKLIVKLDLGSKIGVTGDLSEENLKQLYNSAKVFIRFGYNEKGPGMGSMEALSYGIPLIINDGIGIKEIFCEGHSGFKFDEERSSEVSDKIDELFTNRTLWDQISNYNVELSKGYTWDKHCKALSDAMSRLRMTRTYD
ncbi:hypothetical protein IX51_03840 [uncultured archaeon]|nr:hypothetical protein IX51_03840 [uncultured archaeon]